MKKYPTKAELELDIFLTEDSMRLMRLALKVLKSKSVDRRFRKAGVPVWVVTDKLEGLLGDDEMYVGEMQDQLGRLTKRKAAVR